MNAKDKPILTPAQQVEHMKSKGIRFDIVSEAEAEAYLRENNNYFKLRAYRKNFDKYVGGENDGKYINLDFAMLKDLSIIDMRLRYLVIHMALDTEHFLKVKLLRRVQEEKEDGYQIVDDYISKLQNDDLQYGSNSFGRLTDELNRNRNNPYCGGIIDACSDGYSVWAFIEVIPLGSLLHFYHFCAERFNDTNMIADYMLMRDIREIRNASAHNNCILYDMHAEKKHHRPNYRMTAALGHIPRETRNKHFSNERMLQLCTLMYAHSVLVTSEGVHNHTAEELGILIDRMNRHYDYYAKNNLISSSFKFFESIVKTFY